MCRSLATPVLVLLLATTALWSQPPVPDQSVPAVPKPRLDRLGHPLPPNALDRVGTLQVWHAFQTFSLAFSPDGNTLASGGDDGKIRVWDRLTGKETQCFEMDRFYVHCVRFSPDGKRLAFARCAGDLCDFGLLDLQSGKVVHRMCADKWPVHSLLFTSDGKTLVSGEYESVGIWNTATGNLIEWVELPKDDTKGLCIWSIALTADRKTLALATDLGETLILWDIIAKKELRRWEAKGSKNIAFSPDGKTLVSYGNSHILRLWDPATGKELAQLKGHTKKVCDVTFSPDGKLIASAGDEGTIRLWDPVSGKEQQGFGQRCGCIRSLAFSPDGKTLASASSKIALWDVASRKELIPTPGHKDGVSSLALSPDGKTLVSTGFDNTIRIWDLATGKELRCVDIHEQWTGGAAFSPDGKMLAWFDQKTLSVADTATGKNLRQFETKAKIWSIAFSPNGKLLATGSADHGVDLWDPVNGKIVRTIATSKIAVFELAFSPDGSTLAAAPHPGKDKEPGAFLWETATGKKRSPLQRRPQYVRSAAFSPDSSQVLMSGYDNTLWLSDLGTGKEIRRFQGLDATVFRAAFSPDGNTVAGAVQDGSVRLWETATGKERCRFKGHRSWVMSVVFSPDGRRLISGSTDTTCLVWDVTGLMSDKGLREVEIGAGEWDALWMALAGEDAGKAHQAIWKMVTTKQTAQLLAARLRPIPSGEAKRVGDLVRKLDSDLFEEREQAQGKLTELADIAEPELRRALREKPSPEVQRRIEEILDRIHEPSPECVRTWRALEVLEQIASPEARKVLQSMAAGVPESGVTKKAKAALKRLELRDRKP